MGHDAGLTAERLRLAAAAAPAGAVRRLELAASRVEPLRGCERSVAVLTCARLEGLLASRTGEDELVAALARYAESVGAEAAAPERTPSMRPPARGVGRVPANGVRTSTAVRRSVRGAAGVAGMQTPTVRPTQARPRRSRRPDSVAGSPTDTPPRSPDGVRGLEWLVHGLPPAQAAAESTLDLTPLAAAGYAGVPAARPGDAQLRHGAERSGAPRDGRFAGLVRDGVPPTHAVGVSQTDLTQLPTAGDARAEGPHDPRTSATAPPIAQRRPPRSEPGTGQIAALVRAWEAERPGDAAGAEGGPAARVAAHVQSGLDGEPSRAPHPAQVTDALDGEPSRAPHPAQVTDALGGDPERATRQAASRAAAAAAGDELFDVGNEVGRILVAELRRYGIEVDG